MSTNTVDRSTSGLRKALFDELDALRSGKSNAARANAVGKLAAGIINVTRLEMNYVRFARETEQDERTSKSGKLLGVELS